MLESFRLSHRRPFMNIKTKEIFWGYSCAPPSLSAASYVRCVDCELKFMIC